MSSIAVFGSNGALGAPLIAALESPAFKDSYKKPILFFTRDTAGKKDSDAIKWVAGDLVGNPEGVAAQVKDVDVIISLLPYSPTVFGAIEQVVTLAKPKLYIPSQYGTKVDAPQKYFPGFLKGKLDHSEAVRAKGIKVLDIYTSLFVGGPWTYEINGHLGIDTAAGTVTYIGSPDQKVSFTKLEDIGRTIASLATRNIADLPSEVRVQSGFLTPAEAKELWEARHDAKLEVKESIPKEKAAADAKEEWAKNGFQPEKFLYYLNVLIAQGRDGGLLFESNDNEFVNPGESLWKWEKF